MKLLVIENTNKYESGVEIESADCKITSEGLIHENNFLDKKKYVTLNEEISNEDLVKISNLIDKKLRLMFWRLYTKSKFILQ